MNHQPDKVPMMNSSFSWLCWWLPEAMALKSLSKCSMTYTIIVSRIMGKPWKFDFILLALNVGNGWVAGGCWDYEIAS